VRLARRDLIDVGEARVASVFVIEGRARGRSVPPGRNSSTIRHAAGSHRKPIATAIRPRDWPYTGAGRSSNRDPRVQSLPRLDCASIAVRPNRRAPSAVFVPRTPGACGAGAGAARVKSLIKAATLWELPAIGTSTGSRGPGRFMRCAGRSRPAARSRNRCAPGAGVGERQPGEVAKRDDAQSGAELVPNRNSRPMPRVLFS